MASASLETPSAPRRPRRVVLGPDSYWTETQWQILFALLDGVVPSIAVQEGATAKESDDDKATHLPITPAEFDQSYRSIRGAVQDAPSEDEVKEYLRARPLDNPAFVRAVKWLVAGVPARMKSQLGMFLNFLGSSYGSRLATGYWNPIHQQPARIREAIIRSWTGSDAWLPIWPVLARPLCSIARFAWVQSDPLLPQLTGYVDSPIDYKPGPAFDFDFMQFNSTGSDDKTNRSGPGGQLPEVIETDVVIVGSGCGGGVCAKVLAEAGHRVVVVDKGYYFPPSQLPLTPEMAFSYLFEGGGALQSTAASMGLLAASCWGGGGTVNWSASLQPQGFVRREWAEDRGLSFFASAEFQRCLDRVCDFMGVGVEPAHRKHPHHGHSNGVLLEGARRLGYSAIVCPQNSGGLEHYCGHCALGCSTGEKQGPAVSWLPAAAHAGARFIEGFNVAEVLFDESGGSKRAVGVRGMWLGRDEDGEIDKPEAERPRREVRILAKKVIIAGGSLNSPLLLMRSGLKNPHIGRNLYTHPCQHLNASFEKPVKGYEGTILTSAVTSFENQDGKGHGVKLETVSSLPHLMLYEHTWTDALRFRLDALRYAHTNQFIVVTRDRDTGHVYPDPVDGRPTVSYTASAHDRGHAMQGILALARICYIQGATEIWPLIPGVPSFKRRAAAAAATASSSSPPSSSSSSPRPAEGSDGDKKSTLESDDGDDDKAFDHGINDPDFAAWLRVVEATGNAPPWATQNSAHQMGTCRMATSARDGVVGPRGACWEARSLYVADASVFPSSSGVNPMITTMGIADWIARGIARELARERRRRRRPRRDVT